MNEDNKEFADARRRMIEQLREYGIEDRDILSTMSHIHRHCFIPGQCPTPDCAYGDHAFHIGFKQTISQPFIVAYMTQLLGVTKGMKVLEIGTGSGFQTAILASLGAEVYSLEVVSELAKFASKQLKIFGINNAKIKLGDGYEGWKKYSPFDRILVACASAKVPQALVNQLAENGRMVIPIGDDRQNLYIVDNTKNGIKTAVDIAVKFVPMVHRDL